MQDFPPITKQEQEHAVTTVRNVQNQEKKAPPTPLQALFEQVDPTATETPETANSRSNFASQSPQKTAQLSRQTQSETNAHASNIIHQIPISQILPNPNQPRKNFDESTILKLADSIRQHGIIQPLTVRYMGNHYELVAGERRLRAASELSLTTVPCIIINTSEEASAEIAIIENLLREDLNMFEEAQAIEALIDTHNLTQEQVAERLSCSQSYIANKLRLLRISPELRELIIENKLTERHARALLRLNDPKLRHLVTIKAINNSLNVTQTEELIKSYTQSNTSLNNEESQKQHYKDTNSFYKTITKALLLAKSSNLDIKSRKFVGENYTEVTILIPNHKAEP